MTPPTSTSPLLPPPPPPPPPPQPPEFKCHDVTVCYLERVTPQEAVLIGYGAIMGRHLSGKNQRNLEKNLLVPLHPLQLSHSHRLYI
jgi:hypothetical protein